MKLSEWIRDYDTSQIPMFVCIFVEWAAEAEIMERSIDELEAERDRYRTALEQIRAISLCPSGLPPAADCLGIINGLCDAAFGRCISLDELLKEIARGDTQ